MKIVRHRLQHDDGSPYPYHQSPNTSGAIDHRFLVIHYTAGSSVEGAVRTLTNRNVEASAHLVIGRDGSITQLVPFDKVAWHAGRSNWGGLNGLNRYSIGIELVNAGWLARSGARWKSSYGTAFDDDDVIEAVHKNEEKPRGWHVYTAAQMEATERVGRLLVKKYALRDVVGHDDIAPGRKTDPGPAFKMESFRSSLLGRREDTPDTYETMGPLNIRSGPGTANDKLEGSPLPKGTRLDVKGSHGSWRFVDVLDHPEGLMDLEGWVHGSFIRPVT